MERNGAPLGAPMQSSASCQNLADALYWHRKAKPPRRFRGGLLCFFFTYITISCPHGGATRFLDISSPPFDANALPLIFFARLSLQPIAIGKYVSRQQGIPLKVIADEQGLSVQRVQQIVHRQRK